MRNEDWFCIVSVPQKIWHKNKVVPWQNQVAAFHSENSKWKLAFLANSLFDIQPKCWHIWVFTKVYVSLWSSLHSISKQAIQCHTALFVRKQSLVQCSIGSQWWSLRFSFCASPIASQTVTSLQSHTFHSHTLITNMSFQQPQQNFQFWAETVLIHCNFHFPTFGTPHGFQSHILTMSFLHSCCSACHPVLCCIPHTTLQHQLQMLPHSSIEFLQTNLSNEIWFWFGNSPQMTKAHSMQKCRKLWTTKCFQKKVHKKLLFPFDAFNSGVATFDAILVCLKLLFPFAVLSTLCETFHFHFHFVFQFTFLFFVKPCCVPKQKTLTQVVDMHIFESQTSKTSALLACETSFLAKKTGFQKGSMCCPVMGIVEKWNWQQSQHKNEPDRGTEIHDNHKKTICVTKGKHAPFWMTSLMLAQGKWKRHPKQKCVMWLILAGISKSAKTVSNWAISFNQWQNQGSETQTHVWVFQSCLWSIDNIWNTKNVLCCALSDIFESHNHQFLALSFLQCWFCFCLQKLWQLDHTLTSGNNRWNGETKSALPQDKYSGLCVWQSGFCAKANIIWFMSFGLMCIWCYRLPMEKCQHHWLKILHKFIRTKKNIAHQPTSSDPETGAYPNHHKTTHSSVVTYLGRR